MLKKPLLLTIIENLNFHHMQNHHSDLRSKTTLHFEVKKKQLPASIFRQRSNLRLV